MSQYYEMCDVSAACIGLIPRVQFPRSFPVRTSK